MNIRRKVLVFGIIPLVVLLVIGAGILLYNANGIIRYELRQYLGKGFSVEDISLGLGGVEAQDIRLVRPDGKEAFSVKDLGIRADLIGLLKKENVISDVSLETPNLFLEVDRKGEIVFPWPARERDARQDRAKDKTKDTGTRPFLIKEVKVKQGSLDYLDRKVSARPALIQLRNIEAAMTNFSTPPDNRESKYQIGAVIPGKATNGTLTSSGVINLKTKDTRTRLKIRDLDITQLRAYYEKKGDVEVTQGLLSLDADITVRAAKINSAGKITIRSLEFRSEGGTFLGLPLLAVTKLLKDNNDQITLDFTLQGDLKNPQFNITDSLVQKLAFSLAKSLGMPIEAIGKSVFELGGSALKKLFK